MPGLLLLQITALQPRYAFLLLVALIVGAAVPLAIGWVRLLPEEKPPFAIENPRRRTAAPPESIYSDEPAERKMDFVAVVLLALLTVAFALQFPGVPRRSGINSWPEHFPGGEQWLGIVLPGLLIAVAIAAICYGAMRRSFLSRPLMAGGSLVLVIWIVVPWLYGALVAG